jgi:hypothetical protein
MMRWFVRAEVKGGGKSLEGGVVVGASHGGVARVVHISCCCLMNKKEGSSAVEKKKCRCTVRVLCRQAE